MTKTAVIAGTGLLPGVVIRALQAGGGVPRVAALSGFAPDALPNGVTAEGFRLERLVPFLDDLAADGVTEVVFAGAVRRPRLDPEAFDPQTAQLVPRFLAAMGAGDDAALREVIAIFTEWGFCVRGAHEVAPDLLVAPGVLCGQPDARARDDVARAAGILARTGPLDIGQGVVVAGGLCLALETLPGTAAMLDFVAAHPHPVKGVFYKAPKPDQDRRIDMPTIGPQTVEQAAAAGLAGLAWQADGVLVLERSEMIAKAKAAGLFLWAR